MELNKDIKRRDELIFGEYNPDAYKYGGTRRFEGLELEQANTLLRENFADPNDRQNASPTFQEFCDFMAEHDGYTAHGYAVEDARFDYRVTIEGLSKDFGYISTDEVSDFVNCFRSADEFYVSDTGMYCWYD